MLRLRKIDGCLNEHDVVKLRPLPKFDVDLHAFGQTITRKMAAVIIESKTMYADVITGTLYNPKTGRCNSTRLWIEKVYKI